MVRMVRNKRTEYAGGTTRRFRSTHPEATCHTACIFDRDNLAVVPFEIFPHLVPFFLAALGFCLAEQVGSTLTQPPTPCESHNADQVSYTPASRSSLRRMFT